jgi:lauroyl/myristoyl acyltransferase
MQIHLPPPSRFTDRFHRWAIHHGFPFLAWLATRWPRWFQQLHARWIIFVIMVVYPKPKRMIAKNLARITGQREGSWRVRRQVSALLRQFAFYWVDLFRFAQLPPERAQELVEGVTGSEHLDRCHEAGKGALVLTAHFGIYELGSLLLGRGRPVSVVFVPDKFGDVERFRATFRSLADVEAIPIEPNASWSSLPVLRALRAGRLVAMQGDRDFGGPGVPVTFFGERVRFARGPFLVAMLTGTPIVPTFIGYTAGYRFSARIYPPIEIHCNGKDESKNGGDRETAIAAAAQQWATVLESEIATNPTQWFTFYDYFAEHGAGEEADGVKRETAGRRASA